MRLFVLLPAEGHPVLRRASSLQKATERAAQDFPGVPVEVRVVPPGELASVEALGVAVPRLLKRAYEAWNRARLQKAAATARAEQRRIDARQARSDARRAQAVADREARKAAQRLEKVRATRATKEEARRAAAAAGPAVQPVVLPVVPEGASWAPWEHGPGAV